MFSLYKNILLSIFALFFMLPTSHAQFADGKIIMQDKHRMNDVHTADLNGDGQLDVVGSGTSGILFYFGDGAGNFGVEQILAISQRTVYSISLSDIDNDLDVDIIASSFGDELFYFLNDGEGNFSLPVFIDQDFGTILYITTADMDGDNDDDILVVDRDYDEVVWYQNQGAGLFSEKMLVLDSVTPDHLVVEDIQGDGHLDVVIADRGNGRIVWVAGDGQGGFGNMQIISNTATQVSTLTLADMNGNGTLDLLAGFFIYNDILWYEHDGNGNFSDAITISTNSDSPTQIQVKNINNDTFPDILFSSYYDNKIGLFLADSIGVYPFESTATSNTNFARRVITGDYNQDGHLDIMSAASGKISMNLGTGLGSFGTGQYVSNKVPFFLRNIASSDIDSDGFPDLLSSYYYLQSDTADADLSILKLTNAPAVSSFIPKILNSSAIGSDNLFVGDINGDGIDDFINEPHIGDFYEYYTGNGDGTFDFQTQLFTDLPMYTPTLTDLDGDADLDLVMTSYYNATGQFQPEIFWATNDGLGNFSQPILLVSGLTEFYAIKVGDINNDGALDLVGWSNDGDRIDWFENDGNMNFSAPQLVLESFNGPSRMVIKDLNNDGRQDVLVASYNSDKLAWVENMGNGVFATVYEFPQFLSSIWDIAAEDLDNDGDVELIASIAQGDVIRIYENLGDGNFSSPQGLGNQNGPKALHIADMDVDGDLDIVCASNGTNNSGKLRIYLYENESPAGVMNYIVNSNFDQICSNDDLAFITVNPFGGQAPYTIEWTDNNLNGFTINNLSPGDYIFTVSDAGNTSYTDTIEIAAILPITLSFDLLPEIAGMANGSIFVVPSGGTPPYQYSWNTNPVQSDSLLTNLSAGDYIVTVTDSNGCSEIAEVTLSQVSEILNVSNVNVTYLFCHGDSTATIEVIVAGGLPPYNIEWTDNNLSGFLLSNLPAGNYSFTVTDSLNFSINETTDIFQPPPIILITESTPDEGGTSNGTVSVTGQGGTPPYSYSWNTMPPQNTNIVVGLSAGTYTVTATDSNNCSSIDSVIVEMLTSINQIEQNNTLQFFPNPVEAGQFFSIKNLNMDAGINSIQLVSATGSMLKEGSEIKNGPNNWQYSILNSGVYFLIVTTKEGEKMMGKIIVIN